MPYQMSDNHKIYYEIHGEGTPLIILNGIMMTTESWQILLPSLCENYQVILLDLPNQGRTDPWKQPYTLKQVAGRIEQWLETLKIENAALLGISYGGQVAIHMMAHQKIENKIKRLILANTSIKTSERLKVIGEGWVGIAELENPELFYNTCMPSIYSDNFYDQYGQWLIERKNALRPVFSREWFEKFIRLVNSSKDYDATGICKNIKVPTLIVSGEQDTLTPPSMQLTLKNEIESATLSVLPKTGHASMYESQSHFIEAIDSFLKGK